MPVATAIDGLERIAITLRVERERRDTKEKIFRNFGYARPEGIWSSTQPDDL